MGFRSVTTVVCCLVCNGTIFFFLAFTLVLVSAQKHSVKSLEDFVLLCSSNTRVKDLLRSTSMPENEASYVSHRVQNIYMAIPESDPRQLVS